MSSPKASLKVESPFTWKILLQLYKTIYLALLTVKSTAIGLSDETVFVNGLTQLTGDPTLPVKYRWCCQTERIRWYTHIGLYRADNLL